MEVILLIVLGVQIFNTIILMRLVKTLRSRSPNSYYF
jgi:hypothetical protein